MYIIYNEQEGKLVFETPSMRVVLDGKFLSPPAVNLEGPIQESGWLVDQNSIRFPIALYPVRQATWLLKSRFFTIQLNGGDAQNVYDFLVRHTKFYTIQENNQPA